VPRAGWPAAFLFLVCGVLRLARFNVQKNVVDSRFFVGLPIPAAAAQLAAIVLFAPQAPTQQWVAVLALALLVTLALLMVGTFRYHSFKGVDLRRRRRSISVLGIAIVFLLVALDPKVFLLVVTVLYTLSGPALYLLGLARRRRGGTSESAVATEEPQAAP
jgi:CDP-diacylglycerol--serine O-phosphatidyltransferase